MESPPPENPVSTRGATSSRSGEKEKRTAITKIISAAAPTAEGGDPSDPTEQTTILSDIDDSESSENNDNKASDFKVIPYQGKSRANVWLETVKTTVPPKFEKYIDNYIQKYDFTIPIDPKFKDIDTKLHTKILNALADQKAAPENEALAHFNKLTSHKHTVKRSGVRAYMIIMDTINGRQDTLGATLMQELIGLKLMHNNPEGIATYCQRFRLSSQTPSSQH